MSIYQQPLGDRIRQLAEYRMISYEQPLNEKIRLFMRLELLVARLLYHTSNNPQPENTVAALHILLDLYNLSARLDVKSEILKEIDRMGQSARLALRGENEVDVARLDQVLETLNVHSDVLYQQRGQLGQPLKSHDFFNNLRQRSTLPGGINGFDIPLFSFWQNKPVEQRLEDLHQWSEPYIKAYHAVKDILNIIREFGDRAEEMAKDGFYQSSLEIRKPYQMLTVELPTDSNFYPEISAGKQRFSLRFVCAEQMAERGKQVSQDIPFNLVLCTF